MLTKRYWTLSCATLSRLTVSRSDQFDSVSQTHTEICHDRLTVRLLVFRNDQVDIWSQTHPEIFVD